MTCVEFAVSFCLGKEEAAELPPGRAVRSPRETRHVGELERVDEGRADTGDTGAAVWVEGVTRSYDVRNKMLFIDTNGGDSSNPATTGAAARPATDCNGKAGTEYAATPVRRQPANEQQHGRTRTEEGQRCRSYARHVLDVRLLSCLSSRGEELFDQLRAFSCAFKTGLARASLDVAVDAAADLGAFCREVFDEFVSEILEEGVAAEAYRNEQLSVAAKGTATAAVGSVLRAGQRAVILARRIVSGRAARRKNQNSATMVSNTGTGEETLHRARTPTLIAAVENSSLRVAGRCSGEPSAGHHAITVDRSGAARMCFRFTAIVTEKRRKVPRKIVAAPAVGVGGEDAANLSSGAANGRRYDLQYLTRWT